MVRTCIADGLALAGCLAVVLGACQIHPSLGWLAGGGVCLLLAWGLTRSARTDDEGDEDQ